jgi:hypothetical protein
MDGCSGASSVHAEAERRRGLARFALLLAALVLGAGGLLYAPTFSASYAFDDMDYLNLASEVLAGKASYWETVFRPHLEHLVPAVRMAFHASVALFGVNALAFRVAVFLAHVGAAWFLGMVARGYGGSATAGYATGLAYVVPAGFSSMWVWLMTGAGVPFGLFGLTGAMAALAWRERLGVRRARAAAACGMLLTAAAESTLVPMLVVPILLDELERRREVARPRPRLGVFAVATLAGMAAAMTLAALLYARVNPSGFHLDVRRGLPLAGFLLLVAPFRYLFPGLPLPLHKDAPGIVPVVVCLFGIVIAAATLGLLAGLWPHLRRQLVAAAALAAAGPVAVLALVGLGRAGSITGIEAYDSDRYFFTLLLPISLLAGALAAGTRAAMEPWSRGRRRALYAAVGAALAAEGWAHHQALINHVPFAAFARHEHRFVQLAVLAGDLASEARRLPPGAPPLRFPDTALWFPDVHNGKVSSSLLLYGIGRGIPELRLGGTKVDSRDERLLNPVLDRWALQIREAVPYLSIVNGSVVDAHLHNVADFREDARDQFVASGFYGREGSGRWMGPRGELRLTMTSRQLSLSLAAPVDLLRRRVPGLRGIELEVACVDEMTGITISLGTIAVTGSQIEAHTLDASPFLRGFGAGRKVRLVMVAGPSWRPIDVLPGSTDTRLLTVQVFRAAFDGS